MSRFAKCLEAVLTHEGGFVDHPDDPGGATNKGVTLATFVAWCAMSGRDEPTVHDLVNISDEDVAAIYKANYWDRVRGDVLPPGLDRAMFDFAVNSGVSRAIKFLQRIVRVTEDGHLGPVTLEAIRERLASVMVSSLCDLRLQFLKGLATWSTFGRGWERRVREVRDASLSEAIR